LIFARQDQIDPGATGDRDWDDVVRLIRQAAYQQNPDPVNWHLPDSEFHPETVDRQAHPDDWNMGVQAPHAGGQVRVDRVTTRQMALVAIQFIGQQGEGPTTGSHESHYARFLRIFTGDTQLQHPAFPAADGDWVPSRAVPTNPTISEPPKQGDIMHPRTREWAKLADARYALVLGFIYHYLFSSDQVRQLLMAWIFAEMRSRLGFVARKLTEMPFAAEPDSTDKAAAPFTLPNQVALPDDEPGRWRVHRDRTADAIAITEHLYDDETSDELREFLTYLRESDQERMQIMTTMEQHTQTTVETGFARDIRPLFRPKDIDHMRHRAFDRRIDLGDRDEVEAKSDKLIARIGGHTMPPPPDPHWTSTQLNFLQRWIDEHFPQ
jgi:hypothetical protein